MDMKIKKSLLKKRCDVLFSKKIRERGSCEMCAKENVRLETAHVYGRANLHLRFMEENALCLCSFCHRQAHSNPLWFSDWFKGTYPERAEYLRTEKNIIEHTLDYEELYEKLKVS